MWLGIDVGGAHLKAADGRGWAVSRPLALWRQPHELAGGLRELVAEANAATGGIAATMTGELADCFRTKAEGVEAIVGALVEAADDRPLRIYCTDGAWVDPSGALEQPLRVAAANWHALARLAGRWAAEGPAMLVDVGSTTTDLIPLLDARPVAQGKTDPERLARGELVYTGVVRSPICAVVAALPWRGRRCAVAQEWFATTGDAYVMLGDLPEDEHSCETADGRPATRPFAWERLARSICADRSMFDEHDALRAAETVARAQVAKISVGARQAAGALPGEPRVVVVSGQGEFVARRVVERLWPDAAVVSLAQRLGPSVSQCATAHALAVLADEELGQ